MLLISQEFTIFLEHDYSYNIKMKGIMYTPPFLSTKTNISSIIRVLYVTEVFIVKWRLIGVCFLDMLFSSYFNFFVYSVLWNFLMQIYIYKKVVYQ